jgi:putative hydrolase of the HAD superfamily
MKYGAVIFDLFGTLVDHYGSTQTYPISLKEMAVILSLPPQDFVRLWKETYNQRNTGTFPAIETNLEHICQRLGAKPDPIRIAEAVGIRLDFIREALRPRADAIQTLERLREKNCKIGLISNCSGDVPALWHQTPFAALMDTPVFSATAGLLKPDPQIFRLTCDRLNVSPNECLYVADGEGGELTAAEDVGMDVALIRVPYDGHNDTTRLDPRSWHGTRITSIAEVLQLAQE